ncbi:hypothetical protein R6Q59_011080 [Mikania micrantha]|uniref:WRKY domain-containing protein n=1 Tax=Mikania micrantha TaxID=192012 RepID=A0A5N6N3A1_9ASTR|nr:hypothetical protein E3N88_24933 [Mikania micrantha]
MNRPCVYQDKIVIHELTKGIQMAKQLKVSLHSPQARDLLIQNIISSYEKALFVLKSAGDSAGQPRPPARQPESSSIFVGSPVSEVFEFNQPFSIQHGQNAVSKKRKGSTTWEDQVRICSDNGLEDDNYAGYYSCSYPKVQKCLATKEVQRTDDDSTGFEIAYKGKHTSSNGAKWASSPPPPSLERCEITPTHHHQLSQPNHDEMLSLPRAGVSLDTADLGGDTAPSSLSFPSTSFGLMMDDLQQFNFSNCYDDGLWQVYSPSLDFPPGLVDVDPDSEFTKSLFYEV